MRFADIEDRIQKAADRAGRDRKDITLIAVSKKQPQPRVDAVVRLGHMDFGENQVQPAVARWGGGDGKRTPETANNCLHLIGPLQRNKVRTALTLFDVVHTLDRLSLAQRLAHFRDEEGFEIPPLFVQVNTGEEPQKAGVIPAELPDFLEAAREKLGLRVVGLMAIPPVHEPAALHFGLLRSLAETHGLGQLSMGMSADFETAIELGATHVRVGSEIFGARPEAGG
ncbi:MAG: YggS family pyridoxal phosphate-dependent enzyme [Pseudomonadota bacterium]